VREDKLFCRVRCMHIHMSGGLKAGESKKREREPEKQEEGETGSEGASACEKVHAKCRICLMNYLSGIIFRNHLLIQNKV